MMETGSLSSGYDCRQDATSNVATAACPVALPDLTNVTKMLVPDGAVSIKQPTPSPNKPTPLRVNFEGIPEGLHALQLFVMWRYVRKGEKWSKVPFQINGQRARTDDPATFATLEAVRRAYYRGSFDGIGIVLRNGLCGIDLDHVVQLDGTVEAWAEKILIRFSGTYIERSPSGDGFHILCTGAPASCGKQGPGNRVEVYDESSPRYFTLTGHRYGN